MTRPPCDFRFVSADEATELVVCVHCGRPIRLPNAASMQIVAACRGKGETRWRQGVKPTPDGKPGTALKSLLAGIGIQASPGCACNRRANEMDQRGCNWCEENIDTIVGWLREEAEKRGLPFLDVAGRLLVRRAIRNARRAAAN